MGLEQIAAQGGEMPDGLNLSDQLLFLTLRELYNNFRSGAVNKERGSREKQRIMVAYNGLKLEQKVMDEHQAIRRRLQKDIGNLYNCGCERCKQFLRYLDGIDRRDVPEDVKELQEWNDKLRDLVKQRSERAGELKTTIDRVRWILDSEGSAEERLEKIKEVIAK